MTSAGAPLAARDAPRRGSAGVLHTLVLIGGVLLVALHWVGDIGIYGLLGGKLATYGAQHDQGLSYTLYLPTFALDSVGDVFGSVFLLSAGVLLLQSRLSSALSMRARGRAGAT